MFRYFSRPSGVAAAATVELGTVYKVDIRALVASFYLHQFWPVVLYAIYIHVDSLIV